MKETPVWVHGNVYRTNFMWGSQIRRRYWIKTTCAICGGDCFQDRANSLKSQRAFCSPSCRKLAFTGPNNPLWSGGRKLKRGTWGAILVYAPEHPFAKKNFVPEHRLVMEKRLGRFLTPVERVHHKNIDEQDNGDTNLSLMENTVQHNRTHASLLRCVKWLMENGYLVFNDSILEYEVAK